MAKIAASLQESGSSTGRGISIIETVGLGGVGKTQLAIEFSHRHFDDSSVGPPVASISQTTQPPGYGLVLWVRADSRDSIAKSFRELAADIGVPGVDTMKNDQVVQEVKSKLFRTKCRWLLIFDNFEIDVELSNPADEIKRYLPKGGHGTGHVLITSRVMLPGFDRAHSVRLECFNEVRRFQAL